MLRAFPQRVGVVDVVTFGELASKAEALLELFRAEAEDIDVASSRPQI